MKKLLATLILSLSGFAYASECPNLYPPSVNVPVLENTVELCNSFFVSIFDTNNDAVIVVAERLSNHSGVGQAERINAFHPDDRVKKSPKPSEYVDTKLDKGHMAPAGDAYDAESMHETFLMTNMTPQEPTLNRISWKGLEESVRKQFAKVRGDLYVLNIAIYHPGAKRIGSGIPVPTGYWKIVYAPDSTKFYYADNTPHALVKEVSAVDVPSLIKNAQNF